MGMVKRSKFEGEFLVEINETRAVGTSLSLHLSCICLLGSLASYLPPPSFLAKPYQLREPQEQNPQDPPIWAPAMTVAGSQPMSSQRGTDSIQHL